MVALVALTESLLQELKISWLRELDSTTLISVMLLLLDHVLTVSIQLLQMKVPELSKHQDFSLMLQQCQERSDLDIQTKLSSRILMEPLLDLVLTLGQHHITHITFGVVNAHG